MVNNILFLFYFNFNCDTILSKRFLLYTPYFSFVLFDHDYVLNRMKKTKIYLRGKLVNCYDYYLIIIACNDTKVSPSTAILKTV